jgi:hypothetical protein
MWMLLKHANLSIAQGWYTALLIHFVWVMDGIGMGPSGSDVALDAKLNRTIAKN